MAKQYAAAWYPDPYSAKGSGVLRWYDGSQWTGHVRRPGELAKGTGSRPAGTSTKVAKKAPPSQQQSGAGAGGSWESIPQPGTTFAGGTAPRLDSPGRAIGAVIVLILLAIAGGIVLLATLR